MITSNPQFVPTFDRKRLHCCGTVDTIVVQQDKYRAQHAVLDPSEGAEILRQYEAIDRWHSVDRRR